MDLEQTATFQYKISGTPGKVPFELFLYEDRLVCIDTFRCNNKTFLYKDIKKVRVQNNQKGWPKFLTISLKKGTWIVYDLGYCRAGEAIKDYIEPRLSV